MLVQLGGPLGAAASLQPGGDQADPEERRALARSVTQYAVCAARSEDPRVHRLKAELEATLTPRLRLVVSR